MSSLWTPDGEHPVDPAADTPATGTEELSESEREQLDAMAGEMAKVRAELLSVPAATVVANHAMGLYELAAIHLTADEPRLAEASLAIDALGAVVSGVGDRLGEATDLLGEALDQIRQAYLQVRARQG